MIIRYLLAFFMLFSSAQPPLAGTVTYTDLTKRLYDLKMLSITPLPGETGAQWSSYDRASKYDEASGKYVNWDANGDGGGIIRKENGKEVFAEMKGPGCIVRMWSAAPAAGHVRIYLDESPTPVIDQPFTGYFNNKTAPFNYPMLVHETSSGWNNYVPIPYAKSCKITADPGWGAYFHFNYITFPENTQIKTFTGTFTPKDKQDLKKADDAVSITSSMTSEKNRSQRTGKVTIAPGQKVDILTLKGKGAITSLHILPFDIPADDINSLRELTLSITWDKDTKPSVWAPLGDFFGSAPGINLYNSYPMTVRKADPASGAAADMISRWYMPFATGANIEIINDGAVARTIQYAATVEAPFMDPSTLMRFHAKWHRNTTPAPEPERAIDWALLKTTGPGRFCGVALHVWNPKGGWWGEGDEKFFVDGEKFPSTIGTGSEDYFGYAWCNPKLFQNAFHNQPRNDGDNRGNVCVNRWQISDNIPFQTRFEGDIEKYYLDARPTLYASTVYFYQKAGTYDPYTVAPLTERIGWYQGVPPPFKLKDAIEGETMKVLSISGGLTQVQDMTSYDPPYSDFKQLWWTQAKPGDKLTLALPVKTAGKYSIHAQFTKAVDYGIARILVDNKPLGDPIDFYNDGVVGTGDISLGELELTAGDHQITFEITGMNPKGTPGYMVGLDYILLKP